MKQKETVFVVPTYRLRDVAQTIEKYDENFWVNGHALKIIVFDDFSIANHKKYYPLLEQTKTVNDVFYVGPQKKEQFITFLNERLCDRFMESERLSHVSVCPCFNCHNIKFFASVRFF
ncbi:MAG: hypothetical protein V7K89_15050 [Nostoc sp.]|uniref:hypothetical protein n=1 Tax=Nostoc sp. TaxID=1180 RepID=UPI002FFBAD3D